jgi:phage-related protein
MRSLNELIGLAILSFYALAGAAVAILFLAASLQAFIQWLVDVAFPAIGHFFADLGKAIADWYNDASEKINKFFNSFGETFTNVGQTISQKFTEMRDAVGTRISDVLAYVRGIPGKVVDAIGNLGNLLLSAGRNLIQGLINGIENAIPGLRSTLGFITNMLPNWKGPEDKDKKILKPAGEAVMAGFGAGIAAGAADIRAMLGDFTSDLGGIGVNNTSNSIMFGANALQVNFRGALPTQDEAMATGVAVGAGISSQLAARNTRLAVRTL